MKKLFLVLLLLIIFPKTINAFNSSAECTILMDMDSNRIMYSDNMNKIKSVASISKIMTAILAIESDKIEDTVEIGEEIKKAYGSAIYLQVGEHIKLIDLIYGLMLRSGNDASLAIAKKVGGSVDNFVSMMNEKAIDIGMKNTTFNNPNGLDEEKGNYSTAYDMAILTSYAMKNDTYKKIVKTKKYKIKTDKNTYIWYNKNKMLNIYPYITGGKTGYTEIAKRTLVSTASKDNLNLVTVTLNDGNDWLDHKNLYIEAYDTYKNYTILKKGKINILNETYYLNYEFYIKNDFKYPLKESEKDTILLDFKLTKNKTYQENDKVGKVYVKVSDINVYEDDIYIKKIDKKESSLFQKIESWFKHLW